MAIRVEQITTLEQISKIIWDQQYQSTLMRNRSPYLYRGLPNSNYHLVTSLRRNCKEKKNDIELAILRNFVKYAALEDPALKTSIWRQMIVGQHHGLPSRLLDWTYSVLIALHFATSGENLDDMSKNDAVLWQIDILEMNKRLPKNYQTTLKNESAFLMTVDMMDSLTRGGNTYDILNRYDSDMGTASMVFLEPPIIIFVFLLLTRFFSHFHFFIEIASKSMSFPLAMNPWIYGCLGYTKQDVVLFCYDRPFFPQLLTAA